ncbi:MAG TPA: hypothetical protein ENJ18_00880 [Nannocystis exedens]|nr:hypothetical protein [Nannocystis exedens]
MTMTATESATDTDTATDTSGGVIWCIDADDDGYGDPTMCMPGIPGEDPPDGSVVGGVDENGNSTDDCDDTDPNTFPGAAELDDPKACMTDADDDGYGDPNPSGEDVVPGTDCDDGDADTFPGSAEKESDTLCMQDKDGDGYGNDMPENPDVDAGTDCNDGDKFTFPGAAEKESDTLCLKDEDDDGYGESSPDLPPGVGQGADCFDTNPDLNPGDQVLFSVLEGGDVGQVDADSGMITILGTVDILGLEGEWSVISASVSPDNGMTYVANAAQNRLALMDYCSADAPSEMTVHGRSICGISFDPQATLYGVDSNADELVTFDTGTGSVVEALPITLDGESVNIAACGMAFDCASAKLLISDSINKRILSVDPSSGVATVAATLENAPGAGLAYNSIEKVVLSNSIKTLYSIQIDGSNSSEVKSTLSSSVNDLDYGPSCN